MKVWLNVLIMALALNFMAGMGPSAAAAATATPTQEVKGVADEVIRILKDPALKAPAQRQQRRQLIKQTIDRRFDYEEMAKRCLGPHWAKMTAPQKKEFVKLFGELLEASYGDKIEKYSDEKVNYVGEILEGDQAEVRTVVVRKNDKIPMNYRLLNKSPWMIYDVVIEGVSLVSNYRTQFRQIISEKGYGELVKRLKTKISELHKLDK